jgi:glycine/D-amino acid oxidase-like deaminating enzyme
VNSTDIDTDVAVIGAGVGGVAAALAALRGGARVVLTEETAWPGGQLTSQAVPPDEHPWIERFGCTASYRRLRDEIRAYYRTWYPLSEAARTSPALNPGMASVSGICHEPRVSLAVIQGMLAPYLAAGRLTLLTGNRPVGGTVDGDRVTSVRVRDTAGPGGDRTIVARYVLDGTELGDLLDLLGVEHVTGAESAAETGEPHAPDAAAPDNTQAFSVCFAIDHVAGADLTIDRPEHYGHWRAYRPEHWPGPLLGLTAPDPRTLEPRTRTFVPNPPPRPVLADQSKDPGDDDLWVFRRMLARETLRDGVLPSDVVLVNWPMIDYWGGTLLDPDPAARAEQVEAAGQLSLSMLYWLQTEAPRPDGGTGWPGLRLRPDVTGTADGLAMAPYVRESRRIRALYTVPEQDLALDVRGEHGAVAYPDSVGVGSYRIDLHPSTGGDGYIDIPSCPFQIPLRALVPVRIQNLLPAGKNLGTTHITNGCYRLHPVEWNIGEAAGALAAYCLREHHEPQQVADGGPPRERFQAELTAQGVELEWPRVTGY